MDPKNFQKGANQLISGKEVSEWGPQRQGVVPKIWSKQM